MQSEDPKKTSLNRIAKMVINGVAALLFGSVALNLGIVLLVDRPFSLGDFGDSAGTPVILALAFLLFTGLFVVCLVSTFRTLLRVNESDPVIRKDPVLKPVHIEIDGETPSDRSPRL